MTTLNFEEDNVSAVDLDKEVFVAYFSFMFSSLKLSTGWSSSQFLPASVSSMPVTVQLNSLTCSYCVTLKVFIVRKLVISL